MVVCRWDSDSINSSAMGGSILYYYCRCAIWNATLQINASCNVPVWENIGLILKLSELYCILSE